MVEGDTYAPVGSIVRDFRRQEHYVVLSHNENGSVTVRWLEDGPPGRPLEARTVTHKVPLDQRDEVVGFRERMLLCSRDHHQALARRLGAVS
jgi:hypothetical protein